MLATILTLTLTLALANDDPCARPELDTKLKAPLPANGAVFYDTEAWWPEPDPVLLDADGVEVPASIVEHGSYDALVPDALLLEGSYSVLFDEGEERSFTVEGDEDHQAPLPPVFETVERDSYRSGNQKLKVLDITFEPLRPDQHLLEVEISESGDFAADGYRFHLFERGGIVGKQYCGTFPPGYDHKERYSLRARSVDLAGNTSQWVEHEGLGGVGCSSSDASVSGLLGLLGLLGMRRRMWGPSA